MLSREQLIYNIEVSKAEYSLYDFFRQSWPIIEGSTPFMDSWHIQAIAEHLEAAYERKIKKLLINIPPRTGKTNLISVAFPAWVWIQNPEEKFMYASYAGALGLEHSLKCRRLIESDWYRTRWDSVYKLAKDQNAKGYFENNKGGYRISSSVGGTNTGRGASILVCFPSGTMIMSDQGFLPIEQIVNNKIDCKILSYNDLNQNIEFKSIEEYEKSLGREILEIEFSDGTILECTEEHPIFVEGKGYIAANKIQSGDICLSILSEKH